ncbi:MAG: hypothetical protein K0R39_1763 [Symbiobacteriaceae bacterium]|jgi:hypothetical protein|nr:hypothetical protein [Symbiobacteriaceae bacterium]
MSFLSRWLQRLFPKPLRVTVDGSGYRVGDQWYATQVEVRRRLEDVGLSESEIIDILRDLSRDKYGDPNR